MKVQYSSFHRLRENHFRLLSCKKHPHVHQLGGGKQTLSVCGPYREQIIRSCGPNNSEYVVLKFTLQENLCF